MVHEDKARFAETLVEILRGYNIEATTILLRIWYSALERFDIDVVCNALIAYTADPDRCRYPPKPGDIVGMISGKREDREAAAEHAWRRVLDNLDTYNSAVFDDPAIHYAIHVAFGSWEAVGQMTEDALPFRRRDFVKAYTVFKPGLPYPGRLIGLLERGGASGESRYSVRMIGDRQKCQAVADGGRGANERCNVIDFEQVRRAIGR